jgi:hypothetical protein
MILNRYAGSDILIERDIGGSNVSLILVSHLLSQNSIPCSTSPEFSPVQHVNIIYIMGTMA